MYTEKGSFSCGDVRIVNCLGCLYIGNLDIYRGFEGLKYKRTQQLVNSLLYGRRSLYIQPVFGDFSTINTEGLLKYTEKSALFKSIRRRVLMYLWFGFHAFLRAKSNVQELMYIAMRRFKGRFLTKNRKSSVNVAFSTYVRTKDVKIKPRSDSKTIDKYRHTYIKPKIFTTNNWCFRILWLNGGPAEIFDKSGDSTRFCRILSYLIVFGRILSNFVVFGRIWSNLVEFDRIW